QQSAVTARFVRCSATIGLNQAWMAWWLRFGRALLLVLVAGCSAAPPTHPAQPAAAEQTVAPTSPEPTASAAIDATPAVAPAPTTSAAPPPNPTPLSTPAPQDPAAVPVSAPAGWVPSSG